MAQTAAERRAAQRKLAKDLKAGKRIFTSKEKGQVKAAKALKYSRSEWNAMSPEEQKRLRGYVSSKEQAIKRYATRRLAHDAEDYYPDDYRDDWETWEWDMYKEAIAA